VFILFDVDTSKEIFMKTADDFNQKVANDDAKASIQPSSDIKTTSAPPSKNELSIEDKTTKALQGLASYFSAQFILTATTSTTTGYWKSFLFTVPKYQGLTSVSAGFKNAAQNFSMARSALEGVNLDKFDENAKVLLSKTLNNLKAISPGSRFHEAVNTWLALFDQETLEDTKRFIAQCQMIFESRSTAVHIMSADIAAKSQRPLAANNYADGTVVHFDHAPSLTSTDFIRQDAYPSIFEAMRAVASKVKSERPYGTQNVLDNEILMAKLLSKAERNDKPTKLQSLQTMYDILSVYPKLYAALALAAKNNAESLDLENFTYHCAIMQPLLLTIAEQYSSETSRKEACDAHWATQPNDETNELIKKLSEKLSTQQKKAYVRATFAQTSAEIKDLIATSKPQTRVSTTGNVSSITSTSIVVLQKGEFIATMKNFLKARSEDSAEKLLERCIVYIEALGAMLTKAIETYGNTNEVKNSFDAALALEFITSMNKYVLSADFKASLGIKPADDVELVDDDIEDGIAATASSTTTTNNNDNEPTMSQLYREMADNTAKATDAAAAGYAALRIATENDTSTTPSADPSTTLTAAAAVLDESLKHEKTLTEDAVTQPVVTPPPSTSSSTSSSPMSNTTPSLTQIAPNSRKPANPTTSVVSLSGRNASNASSASASKNVTSSNPGAKQPVKK
jgi:hypothetical protein